jgi:hypothetical protein
VEAIELIYPTKLPVAEKRIPAFERLQLAIVQKGESILVPRQVSLGLGEDLEPLPLQPIFGLELYNAGMAQLIGGYGAHHLLIAAELQAQLEPMDALLDGIALQALEMVQEKHSANNEGKEHLLNQLRSELFLKVPTAGPLDLLRTEEIINRFWREYFNQREGLVRLRVDLQNDLQQMLQRGQVQHWSWRISIVNGRLRAKQGATH